jgi:hypothetical protein
VPERQVYSRTGVVHRCFAGGLWRSRQLTTLAVHVFVFHAVAERNLRDEIGTVVGRVVAPNRMIVTRIPPVVLSCPGWWRGVGMTTKVRFNDMRDTAATQLLSGTSIGEAQGTRRDVRRALCR